MEIKRDAYLQQLTLRKDNGMIKVITGIRRCGKSFLLFTIFKRYLLENGVNADHIMTIALKGSSAVAAASKAYTGNDKQEYDSTSQNFVTALNKALTAEKGSGSAAEKAYLIETHDTKSSSAEPDAKYLVYDKDANGSISENDIIIKLVGTMTNISINKDTGDVTFA